MHSYLIQKKKGMGWFVFLFLFLSACSSFPKKAKEARELIQSGQPARAAEILKPLAEDEGDDQLVYMLEYATALQAAGQYEESNKVLLKAADVADLKDYHSISRIAGSLLLNEGMIQYKGEDYEKMLIPVYSALNFLMLNKFEETMVMVRRLEEILTKYRIDEKKEYEQNTFALYLSALAWEADHEYDNAYISYERVYKLKPNISLLKKDLVHAATLARRNDARKRWMNTFNIKKPENVKDKNYGELVLLYQQGRAPVKYPHPDAPRFPKLYPVPTQTQKAKIEIEGQGHSISEVIYSVQDVAIKTMDDAFAGLLAKRAIGIGTKAVVANEIGKQDKTLGALAWIAMNVADQADLRQWSTLPQTFQVAKKRLKSGKYKIKIIGLDANGNATGENAPEQEIEIIGRNKTFVQWRSFK